MQMIGFTLENIIDWCKNIYARSDIGPKLAILLFSLLCSNSAYSVPKSILVLGDSLSAEYGLARGTGWAALLQQRLQAEHQNVRITNASISGETTSGGKTRLPALLQQRPNIVIIELGANDGLRGLPLSSTENNLRTMIQDAQQANAKVLLIGMRIPPNFGRNYVEKFISIYETVAKQTKVPLVPFLLEGIADKPDFFQSDQLHPTALAQPFILNNIWPELKSLLAQFASK